MTYRRFFSSLLCISLGMQIVPAFAKDEIPGLTVQALSRPSGSIAIGAQRVPMLTVQMTAACVRDVRLSSLNVWHSGLGSPRDIERVYVSVNGIRKSRSLGLSGKEGTARLQLRGFTIPACTTVTFDVLADFSADAASSSQHSLQLRTPIDIVTDPPINVALNLGGAPAVAIPVGKTAATISVELLDLPQALTFGSTRTVARLRLRGDKQDDQLITAVTFTNNGSARDADLQNLFFSSTGHTRLSPTVETNVRV
jgi:hypothetical protein